MANSKKYCKFCKAFKPSSEVIKVNAMHFCNYGEGAKYANQKKNIAKGKKIKYAAQKKSFQLSDLKIRKAAAVRESATVI